MKEGSKMETIDLNRQVVGKDGVVRTIKMIKVDGDLEISYNNFIDSYENYVDPKDLEIETLKAIIAELKAPKATLSKRRLLPEEWKEIEELIREGISNQPIAKEYGISDSSVSKRRIDMRNKGEVV